MPARNKAQVSNKIIVGLDYGTTSTGVCWAEQSANPVDGVNFISCWPDHGEEGIKCPSRIAYVHENGGTSIRWGFGAAAKFKPYSWTKLLLDGPTSSSATSSQEFLSLGKAECPGLLTLPPDKTACETVTDYLREVYKHMYNELSMRLSSMTLFKTPLEFWITVPAIWSDAAKSATVAAARAAGFASREGDTLSVITEPEAAALTVFESGSLRNGATSKHIRIGDGVLVCDCGGGTVDITTYVVTGRNPKLQFEEMLVGVGGKCGSSFIDREFHKWMSRKFGEAFNELTPDRIGPCSLFMREFESAKRNFRMTIPPQVARYLPLVLPKTKRVMESRHYDDSEYCVIIQPEDIREMFHPIVEQVVTLVKQQVDRVKMEATSHEINTIILVGGFANSPYLYKILKTEFETTKNGKGEIVRVLCPPNPQAAIANGAVLRGLLGSGAARRRCRRHYGFLYNPTFLEGVHPVAKRWTDQFDGNDYCQGQIKWQIRKGVVVTNTTSIGMDITQTHVKGEEDLVYFCNLYSCDLDIAPSDADAPGIKHEGSFVANFQDLDLSRFDHKLVAGKELVNLEYRVEVALGSQDGLLKYQARSQGKVIGTMELKMK